MTRKLERSGEIWRAGVDFLMIKGDGSDLDAVAGERGLTILVLNVIQGLARKRAKTA